MDTRIISAHGARSVLVDPQGGGLDFSARDPPTPRQSLARAEIFYVCHAAAPHAAPRRRHSEHRSS
jgi:hypothetical protein